jgi:hypothetical protein
MKNYLLKILSFLVIIIWGLKVNAQCNFTGLNSNYCVNSPTSALSATLPAGTFSGPGMVGSVFSPSLAGPGTHTITYTSNCTTYSVSTGTFAPGVTTGSTVSLSDDQVSSALPIGFTFSFFCTGYTNFYISSNGFITFSANQPNACCAGGSIPSTATPDNFIAYAWTDLHPPSNGSITYTTIGTAPNRTLHVSFNGVNHYCNGNYNYPITSQIKLHETTNLIEIHTTTKPAPSCSSSYPTTMGIENSGGTAGYAVTGRNAQAAWTATNECVRFTPGVVCSATQTTIVSPSTISVVGNNSICVGTTASLTGTGNNTYTWTTTSGTIATTASITATPTINTTYSVAGTNAFGCVARSAITVTVDNTPTITIVSTNTTGGSCPGATLTLTGSGTTTYTWTGPQTITNGVPFGPLSSGIYTVRGSNACGTASAATSISIHPTPNVGAVVSQPTLCSGQTVTFTGTGNATTYTWTGGAINGTAHAPSVSGSYTVTGKSALGCSNTAVASVTVVQTPVLAPVLSTLSICNGGTANISASGATNYTWLPGNSNNPSIVVSPGSPTTYTLIKSNANCVDTKTINLHVNQAPVIYAVTNIATVCASNPATLTAGGGLTYSWSPSGGTNYTAVVSPSVLTVYTVAASDGSCIGSATVEVATNPNPTISIAATGSVICVGDSVSMNLSGALSYTWVQPGLSGSQVVVKPTAPTAYNVSGTNSFGCVSSAAHIVIVNQLPNVGASMSKTLVCSGFPSTLSATGAHTYSWTNGATAPTTTVYPTATTVYTVTGTFTNTQCKNTKTLSVAVFMPTFATSPNTAICIGGQIVLTASAASSYTWYGMGANQPSLQPNVLVNPTVATVYTVVAGSWSPGNYVNCLSARTVSVGIYTNPTITATSQRTLICRYESVKVFGGGGATYVWSNGMAGDTIIVSPPSQITYSVTGTDIYGCKNTSTVIVRVSTCPGFDEIDPQAGIRIYPNPNSGAFTVESGTGLDLLLINELGQVIRNLKLTEGNKYKVQVNDLANGIYFITSQGNETAIRQKIIVSK